MYTPGTELFDGVIHPDAGLYDRYFDIDMAAEEQGCTVHTVTNTLLSMPSGRLIALAEASLTYDVSGLPDRVKIPLPIGKFRTSIDFGITFCI